MLGLIRRYYIKFINMGTFISVYSVSSINKNIINNMEFNMNLITLKRKYNGLAVKLNRTDDEQKEMDRLEALIREIKTS